MLLQFNVYENFVEVHVSAFTLKAVVFFYDFVVTDEIHCWAKGHTDLLRNLNNEKKKNSS